PTPPPPPPPIPAPPPRLPFTLARTVCATLAAFTAMQLASVHGVDQVGYTLSATAVLTRSPCCPYRARPVARIG
ncbi:MAG: hypothetical protein LH491_08780, partial [Pseudoxanthomonas sp.]|nr:hypothetical protein [Pseudoxanthomonas sp.]